MAEWIKRCHLVWRYALAQATLLHGDPAPHPEKMGTHSQFSARLWWPNDWIDQDATWYGGRSRPRQLCVTWESSSPSKQRGHSPSPIFGHVYCGQTAGCIRIPLGTEVGLGQGNIVLDGDPAPPKRGRAPQCSAHVYCGQTDGMDGSRCHLVWR